MLASLSDRYPVPPGFVVVLEDASPLRGASPLVKAYAELGRLVGSENPRVAVRSSSAMAVAPSPINTVCRTVPERVSSRLAVL